MTITDSHPAILAREQLRLRYESNPWNLAGLVEPLADLSEDSPALILGYGAAQPVSRENLIPYFHIVGPTRSHQRIHALIIGGWFGNDHATGFVIADFIVALAHKLELLNEIELTVFPIINVDAFNQQVSLTESQQLEGVHLWEKSDVPHVQLLEREIYRYPYDLVVTLRSTDQAQGIIPQVWPATPEIGQVFSKILGWNPEPSSGVIAGTPAPHSSLERIFTPTPEQAPQPSEVILGLPSQLPIAEQSRQATGILLPLLHALRQTRIQA